MKIEEFHARNAPAEDRDSLTEAVIGAMIEVHRIIGPGLTEALYATALCHELDLRGIKYSREVSIPVIYKGKEIGRTRLDLIVESVLIVELKSCDGFSPVHRAQCITYLRVTGLQKALLVNFNVQLLKDGLKRIVLTR